MENSLSTPEGRNSVKKIVLFSVITVLSVVVGVLLPLRTVKFLFKDIAYYFIFVSFFLWIYLFAVTYVDRLKQLMNKYRAVFLFASVLTVLIFIISPPRFKILNDEANLVGVSMMMYKDKKTAIPLEGYNFTQTSSAFDARADTYRLHIGKRPILYPFLTSLVHTITGYRAYNGIVVNFIMSLCILLVFYAFMLNFFPAPFPAISVLMLAGSPIYIFCVTSSGFETLNLFFVILTFLIFKKYADSGDCRTAELLFLTLVMLIQCRYESKLFVIAVLFLVPVLKQGSQGRFSFITFLIPILLIPCLWQHRVYSGMTEMVQLNNDFLVMPDSVFTVKMFISNIQKNIFALSGLDPNLGFTLVIFVLAVAGLYLIVKNSFFGAQRDSVLRFNTILLFGLTTFMLLLLIISTYHWGEFTSGLDNRLALVLLPYLVFASVYCVYAIARRFKQITPFFIVLFFTFHLLYFWPIGSQHILLNQLKLQYEYNEVLDYILPHYDNNQTLIICEQPNLYVIQNYSALQFSYANSHKKSILNKMKRYYDHIIVIQNFSYNKKGPCVKSKLDPQFLLEEVTRINMTDSTYIKISRLK